MERDAGEKGGVLRSIVTVSYLIIIIIFTLYPFRESRSSEADCDEARRVAQRFLDLEWQGRRLYANKEYDSIMDYKDDDGIEGDEPGWDSANLIDSPPRILNCTNISDQIIDFDIIYKKIGQTNGKQIQKYMHYESVKEKLVLKKTGTTYKVGGLGIYEPYVRIRIFRNIELSNQ